jgi:acetyl-CoA C-acetyltransferase
MEMLEEVAVVAFATSRFTKKEPSIFELSCQPALKIFRETNIDRTEVNSVIVSTCSMLQYTSSIVCEMLGIRPNKSCRLDNLCNSGSIAIASACSEIAAGLSDCALVIGVEIISNSSAKKLEWDLTRGQFNQPVHWASLFARSHMRKFGTTEEQMALVAVKNRKNSSKNPLALFRNTITLEEVINSKKISDPIKLLEST